MCISSATQCISRYFCALCSEFQAKLGLLCSPSIQPLEYFSVHFIAVHCLVVQRIPCTVKALHCKSIALLKSARNIALLHC